MMPGRVNASVLEPEPWGIPIVDVTPRSALDHVFGGDTTLLSRIRHNRLIDRFMECEAHSLHTNVTYSSATCDEITIGEFYHATDKRGTSFIIAVQIKSRESRVGSSIEELELKACEELFPGLTARLVHVEFEQFSWGDIAAFYRLRRVKTRIKCDYEDQFRLISRDL